MDVTKRHHQHLPDTSKNPTPILTAFRSRIQGNGERNTSSIRDEEEENKPHQQPAGANSWDTSDDEIDRQLMEKFPIGAHLPLSNIPYDLINEKCKFLKENTKNDISQIRTRKTIRTLTNQEKPNIERAPLVLLKDRFKGPQTTINTKLGQKIEQIARKTDNIAKKAKKKQGFSGHNLKSMKMVILLIVHPTTLGFARAENMHE